MEPNYGEKADIQIERNGFFSKALGRFFLKSEVSEEQTVVDGVRELLESIKEAKIEWMSANTNFEQAVDFEMIDYYTYRIKASEVRYQYLLKEAKEKGIRV